MTVSVSYPVYFVPIYRDQGKPVKDPSIIGRWHSATLAVGDGSGGNLVAGCYFGTEIDALLAGHTLFDIKLVNWYTDFSVAYALMELLTNELSNQESINVLLNAGVTPSTQYNPQGHFFSDFKFRIGNPTVQLSIAVDNVTGKYLRSRFGGYIYDERYI